MPKVSSASSYAKKYRACQSVTDQTENFLAERFIDDLRGQLVNTNRQSDFLTCVKQWDNEYKLGGWDQQWSSQCEEKMEKRTRKWYKKIFFRYNYYFEHLPNKLQS
ncbi:hypothetical protein Glove_306g53 [Diversispora epigaea]|uniref:Uncharacterized protein n=1 Tax=Diversispora epigaea TaxID=1348612 RepID=A0A397HYK2_9GLOM|nr:hypothetical protein Glove_306g53 [Diversispora epigaea]